MEKRERDFWKAVREYNPECELLPKLPKFNGDLTDEYMQELRKFGDQLRVFKNIIKTADEFNNISSSSNQHLLTDDGLDKKEHDNPQKNITPTLH